MSNLLDKPKAPVLNSPDDNCLDNAQQEEKQDDGNKDKEEENDQIRSDAFISTCGENDFDVEVTKKKSLYNLKHRRQVVPLDTDKHEERREEIHDKRHISSPHNSYSVKRKSNASTSHSPPGAAKPIVINNWREKNVNVVKNWKRVGIKMSFMYDSVLESTKKTLKTYNMISLCATAFAAMLAVLQFGISQCDAENNEEGVMWDVAWVAIIIQVLLAFTTMLGTIIQGVIQIQGYDKTIEEISAHIKQIDGFIAKISAQLLLPPSIRDDAIEFIKGEHTNYTDLMTNAPNLSPSESQEANKKYIEFVKNNSINMKQLQKYYTGDDSIDVESNVSACMGDEYY